MTTKVCDERQKPGRSFSFFGPVSLPTGPATAKQEAMLEFQLCSLDRSGRTTSETWPAKSIGETGSTSSTGTMARGKPTGWKPFIYWPMQSQFELGNSTKLSGLAKPLPQFMDALPRAETSSATSK